MFRLSSCCSVCLWMIAETVTLSGAEPPSPGGDVVQRLPTVEVVAPATDDALPARALPPGATVVPRQGVSQQALVSVTDLPSFVPNLSISSSRTRSYLDTYSLRGLVGLEFLSPPAVVVYLDDAPFGDGGNSRGDWLAVERVEVLRGPQGTRFGKNGEAGVIQVVTRQPGDHWEAEGGMSYASFNTQEYQALAMGPLISNKLSLSLSGRFRQSDGFIHNDYLDAPADTQEGLNGRAALGWTLSEDWDIRLTATGDRYRDGQMFTPLVGAPRRTQASLAGTFNEIDEGQIIRIRGRFAGMELTSVTARRGHHLDPFKFDPDFSPLNGNTGVVTRMETQWSEELRLRPLAPPEAWDWHAGFFYSSTDDDIAQFADFFLPQFNLSGSDAVAYQSGSDTYAVFGELTRQLSERTELTLGLRVDETRREFSRTHRSTLGLFPDLHDGDEFLHVAPKLSLSYHLSDRTLWYASSGLGFRPGGFTPFFEPPSPSAFHSEQAWANELGLETSFWEERVTTRAALFYNVVNDYQLSVYTPSGTGVVVVNAPRGRTYGFELESLAHLTRGWELSGVFGYTDAEVNRVVDPFSGRISGDVRPPFAAAFNGGAGLLYRHEQGWFGRVHFSAVGDTYSDIGNTQFFRQRAYGILGARVGYEGRKFGLAVFGENLTDTEYYSKKVAAARMGALGRPRMIGMMVTAKY